MQIDVHNGHTVVVVVVVVCLCADERWCSPGYIS